jgi:glycosyltransferase involved in cell wall biosynthesis
MLQSTLSVLIPLYNEEEFIRELLKRVVAAPLPDGMKRELIVVDDASNDGSAEVVRDFMASCPDLNIRLIRQYRNRGKGAAVRLAIEAATGEYSIIQDADLEYDPREYRKLLGPLLNGDADVVYGSRFLVAGERRVLYYWHALANRFVTTLGNIAADLNLTDIETGYKAFRTSFAKTIPIESNRFGIDPELTIKFARRGARIYETPISYHGRTYEEGKKIGKKAVLDAVWTILRTRFTSRLYTDTASANLDALSFAPKFNRWMADTIAPWMGHTVLEIGAGMGNMTRPLCARRKLYIVTDADAEHVERLRMMFRHRPSVYVAKLDASVDSDFEPFRQSVDTVVCLNVLEHIRDDGAALKRIRTLLRENGWLILLVPNDPRAFGAIDRAVGHYRRYGRAHLAWLLNSAGFDVEGTLGFNRVSMPGWRFAGQVMKSAELSRTSLRMFDRLVWLWRRIDRALPWAPVSIIAIARRRD